MKKKKNEMKKILFLMDSLRDGGAEKILVDILNNVKNAGYLIELKLIRLQGFHLNRIHPSIKLTYIRKEKRGLYASIIDYAISRLGAKLLFKLFIHRKYDIAIAFMQGPSTKIISGGPANMFKISWVHSDLQKNNWADSVYRNEKQHVDCYKRFRKIVCVSEGVRQAFVQRFGCSEKTIVCYNPIDIKSIIRLSKLPIELNYCQEYTNIVSAGRFVEQKAFDRLIRIVERLINDSFKIRLYLLGCGKMENELKEYVNNNLLNDSVYFLGYQSNPYPYYRKADIFIVSSIVEGYSTVATEALILGVPVIATNCAGMEELLGESEFGFITDNSEEHLYEGIKHILTHQDIREYYRKQALLRSNQLSHNINMERISNLLFGALNGSV